MASLSRALTTTLAGQLAERMVELRAAPLPDDVAERACLCVLDQLGNQLRGATLPHVQPARRLAELVGRSAECSVPMHELRLTAPYAALVTATFGHSCEYDDSHFLCGHPGACVIPTVLAVGEQQGASGEQVLRAVVAGYEAMVLAIGPIHPTTMATGWHGTKLGGVFGSVGATAELINLDVPATAHALAIAGGEASGTLEYDQAGGEVKRVHPGMAARSGIESAWLARAGLTGPLTIFEGERGIYRLFGDGSAPAVDAVWSRRFHIRDVMFKLYPAVGTHQAPLDALRYLIETEGVRAQDVSSISVLTAPWALMHGGATDQPADMISAQFNLGFSLAVRLLRSSNAISLYADRSLWSDPEIRALSEMTTVRELTLAPDESELGAAVEVVLRDGRLFRRREYAFRGHPLNPASSSDIETKFRGLVEGLLPDDRTDQILDAVWNLGTLRDIRELTTLLRP